MFLPIAGTNPTEHIVPPYSRYDFRSSLKQEPIPLRKLSLPIAGTNSAARLLLPIAGSNPAADIVPRLSQEQIPLQKFFLPIAGTSAAPPYRRSKFCCGSFFSISYVQIPLLNCSCPLQVRISQLKLFLPIAGTNPAEEIVPPRSRCKLPLSPIEGSNSAAEVIPPFRRYKFRC